MNEYIELAKKLKALAERGEGGEKYNAQKKLDRVMEKYGITKEMLEEDTLYQITFKIKATQRRMFMQILASIVGMGFEVIRSRRKPTLCIIQLTKLQEAELRAKFGFYWRAWELQQEIFMEAFIMKNDLYPKDGPVASMEELTVEQMAKTRKAFMASQTIERASYRKPIK